MKSSVCGLEPKNFLTSFIRTRIGRFRIGKCLSRTKIVFIQLHKTGCSHISRLLLELLPGELVGRHRPADAALHRNGRAFLGSIRNPWTWYVSLWAYGCDRKGHVYNRVTKSGGSFRSLGWRHSPASAARSLLPNLLRRPDDWNRCYADVNDPSAFRQWLYMIHDRDHWNDFGEGYGSSSMNRFAGLFTYRYITLFVRPILRAETNS